MRLNDTQKCMKIELYQDVTSIGILKLINIQKECLSFYSFCLVWEISIHLEKCSMCDDCRENCILFIHSHNLLSEMWIDSNTKSFTILSVVLSFKMECKMMTFYIYLAFSYSSYFNKSVKRKKQFYETYHFKWQNRRIEKNMHIWVSLKIERSFLFNTIFLFRVKCLSERSFRTRCANFLLSISFWMLLSSFHHI